MGLFGALSSGVSGLNAQSTSIAIISDNVSNINTVGYKAGQTNFSTLVTNAIATTSYASGAVKAGSRQQIDKQGLIEGTGVVTDLAVSGDGFFSVNSKPDGSGDFLYTRAGAFRQDNRGNFVNGAGFYLMAWPLDGEGRLPGEVGNLNTAASPLLESLQTVNINSVTGVAAGTSSIDVGLNLDASQTVLKGSGDVITLDTGATFNQNAAADHIIAPNAATNMTIGDGISVTSAGVTNVFTYGGFVTTNDITGGILGATTATQLFASATAGDNFTITTANTGTTTFTYTPGNPSVIDGQFNDMNTLADAINEVVGLTARVVNNQLLISPQNAEEAMTFSDVNGGFANHLGLKGRSPDLTQSTVLGSNAAATSFNAALATVTDGDNFTVSTATGTITLTFRDPAAPTAALGEFDSLTTMVAAINDAAQGPTIGVSATLIGDAIHISTTTPTPITFTDQTGIFASSLGLAGGVSSQVDRFNSMTGLAALVNDKPGIAAIIENPLDNATLEIHAEDPLGTIAFEVTPLLGVSNNLATTAAYTIGTSAGIFTNGNGAIDGDGLTVTVSGVTYTFSALEVGPNATLGQFNSLDSLATAINTFAANDLQATVTNNTLTITGLGSRVITSVADAGGSNFATTLGLNGSSTDFMTELGIARGPFGPAYDPNGTSAGNMATGVVTPHFSRNVRVFDAQGTGHDLRISFLKLANNTWNAEVYAVTPSEIVSTRTDGLLASGTIQFNGDGSLRSIDTALTNELSVSWSSGASAGNFTFDFGTAGSPPGTLGAAVIGQTDGLRQFNAEYNVEFVDQNGVAAGLLTGVSIDEEGFMFANFSNGESRAIFKLPLADFANPNGLQEVAGNAYRETQASGNFNLREPGKSGAGTISSASLESANVELADELTRMIVAQRGYQASARVISTVDDLLEELNRIF